MNKIDSDPLPVAQRERVPVAMQRASAKLDHVTQDPAASRLVRQALAARTAVQRVQWVQRAASAWSAPLEGVAACRKGCSHCCHIPVTISRIEASMIGRSIGREPADPALVVQLDTLEDDAAVLEAEARLQAGWRGTPCPFLRDDACSIYAHRPMACRTLLNLDDDALLCELVDGVDVPVPYADARHLKAYYLAVQPNAELADIRAFFPAKKSA